jgi:hypothetical protein
MSQLEAKRQLLIQQCELDRIELALAWHDLRRSLRLGSDVEHEAERSYPWLGRAIGYAIPLLGATRARRFSRYLSLGLIVWRIANGLRSRR